MDKLLAQLGLGLVMGAIFVTIGGLAVIILNLVRDRRGAKKEQKNPTSSVHEVEGGVAMKYVCYPRVNSGAPVIQVPYGELKYVRKTGECELMLQINCNDGYSFAEWVSPQIFDAVKPGTKMTVTYSLNTRTNERKCISLKRHE
ncbi:hypothetical protein A2524_03675 [Candidatus Wolfebacteria bacterium RIFOXYD12_FULL_48_21]|uniref:Uncharacterized protein n=1 Tax=Candidatus Wolfebacteria bacterium RIFOXYD1_FULL_48_65 TaxID=1802561 RepID=A0A1F8DYR4_9BACT|nr:MAG: hypothetical protein A2610_00215 [Candidatus Wolfebacteria bacterium RIFOXYD1_FULL_48_65]OGM95152.1 MAG: hypothetical protein A2524_03675 [Candidatus Wolfebacteria bacterium RIFOXYD12_FULL_48_21]OGM95755.1 MAG: hypothetical protein A2532_03520 [Candidatus Wolfebacteria bacterium RIFOXYD2_FULL_48_11]